MGTSSDAVHRTWSSETDFWKGEAVFHRCCHPAKPWSEKKTRNRLFLKDDAVGLFWLYRSFWSKILILCSQRRDFEQQKAFLVKQQYLCDSPLFGKGALSSNRRESTALSEYAVKLKKSDGLMCWNNFTPEVINMYIWFQISQVWDPLAYLDVFPLLHLPLSQEPESEFKLLVLLSSILPSIYHTTAGVVHPLFMKTSTMLCTITESRWHWTANNII